MSNINDTLIQALQKLIASDKTPASVKATAQKVLDYLIGNNPPTPIPVPTPPAPPTPVPTPTPVPVPPRPTPNPVAGMFKGCLFFPWSNPKPAWISNGAYPDCSEGFASSHGSSWEDAYRQNLYKQTVANGGNTVTFIAESLFGQGELEYFLCNRMNNQSGKYCPDSDNSVVQSRKIGVTKWIVCLFDSPDSKRLGSQREAYLTEMCGMDANKSCYAWATPDQVAFLIGLECNRNMSVATVVSIAASIRAKCGGKAIIVGSSQPDFLKACYAQDKGLALWLESATNPCGQTLNVASEVARLKDLIATGAQVILGEAWGDHASLVALCKATAGIGLAGYGSWAQ